MKGKIKYIVVIILLIVSVFIIKNSSSLSSVPKITNVGMLGNELGFKIVRAATELKPGDKGYIAISGKGGTKYTITSSYKRADKYYLVKRVLKSNESGDVTLEWTVDKSTAPGTYPIRISSGKKYLDLSHTVLE
jgi:hypothetical protein